MFSSLLGVRSPSAHWPLKIGKERAFLGVIIPTSKRPVLASKKMRHSLQVSLGVCLPLYFYRSAIIVPTRVTCFGKNKFNQGHNTTQQELGAWKVAIPHLLGWHFLLAQDFGCVSTMSRTQMEREKSIQPSGCFHLHNAMHLGPSGRWTEFFHFLPGCLVWCRWAF